MKVLFVNVLTFLQSSFIARCRRVYPWPNDFKMHHFTFFLVIIAALEKLNEGFYTILDFA